MENGKSAVARDLKNECGFGSTEFHVIRPIDPTQTLPEYLWTLLRVRAVRQAARRYFIGSDGQQRVPADFLEELVIPVPSPEVQLSIVEGVQSKRRAISEELLDLKAFRKSGIAEIERDIINGQVS